ncbi:MULTISPECIES: twin-arginine translocase subunit TatC [unclassified Sporosarcina]|uniref:twin-arginine translocase subunit TatC n=1 Tax=unclassified Sporosarcina TaxID=2647733 RepID=UPI00203D9B99|nr:MULTISPECIES: twin-arginine translocase subunit TatC [unclassified Sporosarcina]GKV66147.1 Sec-independent protein translocase protein TatCy [Sporosarcina sp. NCCP-2331]GLB56245.1 Sec-independent protein translocase protein TatCy [Sporosarcina sp. NCCP-2378]
MADKNLTIIEHIDEVRKRLMVIVVFFIVGVIAGFFFAKPLIHFIQYDTPAQQVVLNAFNVIDPVVIYLKVIVFLAIVIISPVIMYQFWAFISPGLRELERKVTLSYIPFAFLLFIGGISFSYFVLLPYIMKFMINLSDQLNIEQTIGINEYFSFLFSILLPFGFVFQLPIVILFLSRLGVLEPKTLVKVRKYAYFGLFVLAAFITPPDIVSHLFVTVPLFILYEISIVISRLGYRKYEKAERLRLLEEAKAEQQRQIDEVLNRTDEQ